MRWRYADALQVEAKQVSKAEPLLPTQILFSFEETPAGFLQQRLVPGGGHMPGFGGPHLIQAFVHFGDDVETVQDVQRPRALLTDHPQVGLPHVGTNELDLRSQFWADQGEEALAARVSLQTGKQKSALGIGRGSHHNAEVRAMTGQLD
jgi:hypothetical protein